MPAVQGSRQFDPPQPDLKLPQALQPRPPSKFGAAEIMLAALILIGAEIFGVAKLITVVCGAAPVGDAPGLSPEQNANAHAITEAAINLGLGQRGALIGITVALTESDLINVDHGDIQNGSPTSSRGLFQQLAAWGPLQDRMDPVKAATMFYTGGQGGQPGLMDITGWQEMSIPAAAQAVQQSEFADGSNYAANLDHAQTITDALGAGGRTCTIPTFTPAADTVRIPDDPNVAPPARGVLITAPTPGIATGLATGFTELGQPYVWGGSGDDGCVRGGGALNSCQGLTGWDCSGLTRHVLLAAGAPDPGLSSTDQRNTAHTIPWAQGQPGDIVGFPGHVAIYLGQINDTDYILEASQIGTPVHIVPLTRTDHDPNLYRY